MVSLIYRAFRRVLCEIDGGFSKVFTLLVFAGNGVKHSSFRTSGVPYVAVWRGGVMRIGRSFSMHNKISGNPIGCYSKCTFVVGHDACLTIGDNVGISQSALSAMADITIGDNVKIGGGTSVFTTDFHSLNPDLRSTEHDGENAKKAPVVIGNNAFIGAYCIILKGVTIGENSIVGAGSVVTKPIPANQIWAGNPARFIKEIPSHS